MAAQFLIDDSVVSAIIHNTIYQVLVEPFCDIVIVSPKIPKLERVYSELCPSIGLVGFGSQPPCTRIP